MTVKIFVDWRNETVLTETEYKGRLIDILADKEEYRYYETDYLEEHIEIWLDKHHCTHTLKDVFNMSERERKEVLDMCREGFEELVEQNFAEDWEEIEIEV